MNQAILESIRSAVFGVQNHEDDRDWAYSLIHNIVGEVKKQLQPHDKLKPSSDEAVDHPVHYTSHASGVECIQVTEQFGFNLGNAIKYIWRADDKGRPLEDLKKARWYVDREIQRRLSLEG